MKKLLKWIGIIFAGLLGFLIVAAVILYLVCSAKFSKKYDVPVETISIPSDATAVQRGEHLATIFLCTRCHSEDLGGQVYFDAPGLLSIPTPNLTSGDGGVGSFYTDKDWVRAIRHGVSPDGRALFLMLSNAYQYLGEEDLSALIAYLKTIPPVDNKLP